MDTALQCQDLSQRHMLWGYNVPAVDIDFFLVEYDSGKCAALIEYKHENAGAQDYRSGNWQALIDLADRASLPLFYVRYSSNFEHWRVKPMNACAGEWMDATCDFNEEGYVDLLYRLRGRSLPPALRETGVWRNHGTL